ncbi:competence protein ComJ [Paenibacillus methanolicus]|uniref:Competence protein J (ComJ) n=1 Tax=Paenibacillus methanolicus TaxID=582686 RepID=A0A5S5BTD7_9BACL|nr:competence protein ComJ [Paenibacillus methanolicus]TYP70214.1 competence protein J (ComJ) [Paenibacillus methanolicus]
MKQWPKQELTISYSQLTVYNQETEHPFSDWTDAHIRQGFTWREGAVSFGAIGDERSIIEVAVRKEAAPEPGAIRAIVVPFETGEGGVIVSSILSEAYGYDVPQGSYELWCEIVPAPPEAAGNRTRYLFTFVPCGDPKARIAKRDAELDPGKTLLMVASPAI